MASTDNRFTFKVNLCKSIFFIIKYYLDGINIRNTK